MSDTTGTGVRETVFGPESVLLDIDELEVVCADGERLVMTRRRAHGVSGRLPAVLMVHGLAQNRFTWQLSDRSLPAYLAKGGFDVFVLELRSHGRSRRPDRPYPKSFAEHADLDVPAAIEAACLFSGNDRLFYIGHGLGGTMGYCQTERQHRIAGLVQFGAPAQIGAGNRVMQGLGWIIQSLGTRSPLRYFKTDVFTAEPLGAALRMLIPYLDQPGNRFPLQLWEPRSIKRDALAERLRQGFDHGGRAVVQEISSWSRRQEFRDKHTQEDYTERLRQLYVPILILQGDHDHVSRLPAVEPVRRLAQSTDITVNVIGNDRTGRHYGHFDLILGDHAPYDVWPLVRDWMQQRAGK